MRYSNLKYRKHAWRSYADTVPHIQDLTWGLGGLWGDGRHPATQWERGDDCIYLIRLCFGSGEKEHGRSLAENRSSHCAVGQFDQQGKYGRWGSASQQDGVSWTYAAELRAASEETQRESKEIGQDSRKGSQPRPVTWALISLSSWLTSSLRAQDDYAVTWMSGSQSVLKA